MKLITHNMLTSKVLKNVVNGFPLKVTSVQTEVKAADFQPEFVARMMKRVDYKALLQAAQSLGYGEGLPECEVIEEVALEDEELLKKLHRVLLEVEVIEGELECPETGRKFPIKNSIPNMLINEDEQ